MWACRLAVSGGVVSGCCARTRPLERARAREVVLLVAAVAAVYGINTPDGECCGGTFADNAICDTGVTHSDTERMR